MAGWNADTSAGSLGVGTVTLVDGAAFCISSSNGDMSPEYPQGVFVDDTRVLSRWNLTVDGGPLEPLATKSKEPYRAIFVGRVAYTEGQADSPLIVERTRELGAGIHEQVTVRNYSPNPAECVVSIRADVDFADLFEVKEARIQRKWEQHRAATGDHLVIRASWQEIHKEVVISAVAAKVTADGLTYTALVPPHGQWSATVTVSPTLDDAHPAFIHPDGDHLSPRDVRRREWVSKIPIVRMGNPAIERTLLRSYEDLGALRIEDPDHPERIVVAAGAPWFMALFGRDSLWASIMAIPVDPSLALGTIQTLADRQGSVVNPMSEEEPGKILHEVRLGVSTGLALGGGSAYYGSVDATPLFVAVLGEVSRWGFAPDIIKALLPSADRALDWIRHYGDRDGDGFVEYKRLNNHGLINQGWKDSWDGINFADGRLAEPPIALCEVQAYVYAAYQARAWMAYDAGDVATATELSARADQLKKNFNEQFWLPDRGYYAVALDAGKKQVDACASNMGHCLLFGLIDEDKAPLVAERLMSPEMFSGWGIRTLASDMGAYNPASYHNGSVWPHDNAIIAAGLLRYGFVEEAQRISTALFDAAEYSQGRLPELFCGFSRADLDEPVPYPTACSPQAWAATTPIQLVKSLMGYRPDLARGELWMDPALPESYGDLHISNAPMGDGRITIDISGTTAIIKGLPQGVQMRYGTRPRMDDPIELAKRATQPGRSSS
ncbi:amylo-alpha-1,6-glucosidase [Paenarthrobacter nitroguajacolicus]|uniref:amylo-alpha-1,6-glucosidase n=1 Tax=Paenarthrobacter nitroguajacolicus TaxID=211146 RepID=UPI0015BCBB87|nr:amylo-alpha-1,6-glucosidase [Paenarthrobacter nitroguajacolicus]NWL10421.1 amylo-alpha-1,6-glucosidase [Paenarthrobacter nitroguajacolicus]